MAGTGTAFEQPGPNDRSALPSLERSGNILDEVVPLGEQLVSLGVGLHEGVFDAVMHHLGVVTGTDLASVHEAFLARVGRTQGVEYRHEPVNGCRAAADHKRKAVLLAPGSAGNAGVDVVDSFLSEKGRVHEVVAETGIAAVDDQVAGGQKDSDLGDDGLRDGPGGDPYLDGLGRGKGIDEVLEGRDVGHVGVAVVAGYCHAVFAESGAHAGAHFSEADEADVHVHGAHFNRVLLGGVA